MAELDINYKTTLLAIAKKQRELLGKSFDWENCEPIEEEPVKHGLFRKKKLTEKEQLRNDLSELQREADELRRKIGVPEGVYWWNLPWDMVEKFLVNDLTEIKRDGGWRFESSMKAVPIADNIMYLMMREEGHCSNFSCQTIFDQKQYLSRQRFVLVWQRK